MKKLLIASLLFTLFVNGQTTVRRTIAVTTDIHATKVDGFNIGAEYTWQHEISYFKALIFVFPDLNNLDYIEVSVVPYTGFSIYLDNYHWRVPTEFQIGFIYRETGVGLYPKFGFYTGLEYYTDSKIYFGISLGADYATDSKVWDSQLDAFWRPKNCYVKIGINI